MGHPIYGKANRKLETVTIKMWLPLRENDFRAKVVATGETSVQRSSLWSHCEMWPDPLDAVGMSVSDAVSHLALISLQDAPTTQEMFDYHLHGGAKYEEPKLPF